MNIEVKNAPIFENYKKSVKILAIGNSFSSDAMEHLGVILKGAGIENISLGNLYIGGCSLETHYRNIQTGEPNYEFRTNTGDGWNVVKESIDYGILYDDWDVIAVQQVSNMSGMPESFTHLEPIIAHVKKIAKNPNVKILWHMTWAYQGDSQHPGFSNYNCDQKTMYNAIVSGVKERINQRPDILGVIPSGVAVQKLRESYLGDNLTRDGFHLTLGIGRYAAALTWFGRLTGADVNEINATPESFPEVKENLDLIKAAVSYALENNPEKAAL